MEINQKQALNLYVLFYFSQIGDSYYAFVLPAMALFFSENVNELKITISIYFFFTAILQLFPDILTHKIGFRKGIIIYFLIFIIGTLVGYFYQGSLWVIILSRSLQAIGLSVLPLLVKSLMYLDEKRVQSFMILREILAALAGPVIVVIFGYLMHYSSWKVCYLLIFILYSLALLWLYIKLSNFKLSHNQATSPKKQFLITLSIFKHTRLVLLGLGSVMALNIKVLILCVYAFIFIHDFHAKIYYVGYIPLLFAIIILCSLSLIPLLNKLSKYKVIITFSIIQILLTLFSCFMKESQWMVLIIWSLLMLISPLNYIYLNQVTACVSKSLKMVVPLNTLYYFLRNMIPMISILIWARYGKGSHIDLLPQILLFLAISSFICIVVGLKKTKV